MQPRGSLPDFTDTATQLFSRMALPEEIPERRGRWDCLSVRSIYPSMIRHGSAVGDSIMSIENWQNPTHSSATIGAIGLALRVGRLGTTFSNTNFLSNQGSVAIANSLAQVQNPAIKIAVFQIENFCSRNDGWKGPNSLGPTARTIDDAKTFATVVLADSKIEPPHIGLAADGEITFFWQNPKITIDLSVAGDGTYAYFAKSEVGQPFFEDAAPVTVNLPEEILSLLRVHHEC